MSAQQSRTIIEIAGVSKIYPPNIQALDSVSFNIYENEFVSVVGRSGAGKSTLIKMLIGEEKPSAGRIFFEDEDISQLSKREIPALRRKIGIIFQDFRLLPIRTAYENIAFTMEVNGLTHQEIKQNTLKILSIIGLQDRASNFPHELSGGEKQRIAIGRALALRPRVLVADEPTGNLDPIHTWDVINLLVKINELGTTVILASHDKEVINSLGKRVVSMVDGRIARDEREGRYYL